jgi:peptidoglycan/LPS O-acetylase OafA/YrhL
MDFPRCLVLLWQTATALIEKTALQIRIAGSHDAEDWRFGDSTEVGGRATLIGIEKKVNPTYNAVVRHCPSSRVGMQPNQNPARVNRYVPALEGIRGYGLLLIFCAHYFLPFQLADRGTFRYTLFSSLSSLAIFALPGFFVVSGFLIGGILYHTRNREGFFRIFYGRRILRIFPVYYVTLLAIYIFLKTHGIVANYRFWVHFLYIQNLLPGYTALKSGPVGMLHFWSLAMEEQFYILWPLVVWLFPEKKKLLKIAIGLILCSFVLRAAAPLVTAVPDQYAYFTPTCVSPILLGVVLSLLHGGKVYQRFEWMGKWIVVGGASAVMVLTAWKGREWASTFWGEEIIALLTGILGVALVVAIQEKNSLLQRLFSVRWVCWLGGLSYSAYVFHLVFAPFFFHVVSVRLSMYMRPHLAVIASGAIAFCLTIVLSLLSRVCIEGPAMVLKGKLRYGAERSREAAPKSPEELIPSAVS